MRYYEEYVEEMKDLLTGIDYDAFLSELHIDGPCYDAAARLFRHGSENSYDLYSQRMKELEEFYDSPQVCSAHNMNTYPMGEKTDRVYCSFFGICAASMKIRTILEKADQYCVNAIAQYPLEDKTVLILTDKWDDYSFRQDFALRFTHYALDHHIAFVILLVTDYGVTRIPFLTSDRYLLRSSMGFEASKRYFDKSIADKAYDRLIQQRFCTYSFAGGTWNQYDGGEYEFDFLKGRFRRTIRSRENPMGDITEGRIPKQAARDFALEIFKAENAPDQEHQALQGALDLGFSRISLGGKEIRSPAIGRAMEKLLKRVDKLT